MVSRQPIYYSLTNYQTPEELAAQMFLAHGKQNKNTLMLRAKCCCVFSSVISGSSQVAMPSHQTPSQEAPWAACPCRLFPTAQQVPAFCTPVS